MKNKDWDIVDKKITEVKVTQLDAEGLLRLRKECNITWMYTWKCLYKNENNSFTQ